MLLIGLAKGECEGASISNTRSSLLLSETQLCSTESNRASSTTIVVPELLVALRKDLNCSFWGTSNKHSISFARHL